MKRVWLACAAGVALLAAVSSPVFASCPAGIFNPVQHAINGTFTNCPDANPVGGFVYTVGSASTINSASTDVICEADGPDGQLATCQPDAGVAGDGIITVKFDYGNPGTFPGCPNPGLLLTPPRQVIQIVANDGSSLLVSVGWSAELQQYAVDFAQPAPDFPPPPLSCSHSESGLRVLSFDGTTLEAEIPAPKLYSDCDLGTWGETGGGIFTPSCGTSPLPPTAPGRLYSRFDRCGTSPNPLLSQWALLATPDAAGRVVTTVPRSTDPDTCTFVGASGTIGGAETMATVGNLQIQSQNPPAPRALSVRARRAGGEVILTWSTAAELNLVGFNVLGKVKGGKELAKVSGLIAAQGGPTGAGASYEHRIPMSRLQGAHTLYVESVLSTGGTLLSDPASF